MNKNKSTLFIAFYTVLIDLIGFGIVLPLLPFFAKQFSASALTTGLLFSIYSMMQFFISPFWGKLSDRIGRKPIMIISTSGAAISYLIFAFSNSLIILFISRILAGMMAGNIATAQAIVSDCTPKEKRLQGMGMLGASIGLGFVLGPCIAMFLVHPIFIDTLESLKLTHWAMHAISKPYFFPGIIAMVLSTLSLILVIFLLPETKPSQIDDSEINKKPFVLQPSFWKNLALVQTNKDHNILLKGLLLSSMIFSWIQSSLYGIFPLFCQKYFDLKHKDVALIYIFMGLLAVLIQGGGLRAVQKRIGEKTLFKFGLLTLFLGYTLIPWTNSIKFLYIAISFMTIGTSLLVPLTQTFISKQTNPNHIGWILGASQSLTGAGRVLGPAWGGFFYGINYTLPFIITPFLLLIPAWVLLKNSKHM